MAEAPVIAAAGVVVCRKGSQLLLVHRPKYDDWSFPKGKLDPGEHATTAAVREAAEETGLRIRLGVPLTRQHYQVQNGQLRDKQVDLWTGRVRGSDDVSAYRPNAEIDAVAWVPLAEAAQRLTYERDRATLQEFAMQRRPSEPLVVLRHAKARARQKWAKDDRLRPLGKVGRLQAEQLVPVLSAYGVTRVLSSSSTRCWSTVSPFADVLGLDLKVTRDLSEEDATPRAVERRVHQLLAKGEPAVLCSHKPVLPLVFDALGLRDPRLRPGAMLVVHHHGGQVVAVELHDPLPPG
jgi:8-oxo-dGTP pyrophosphatase MutT (NUDIX family)/phosphohistidine phosphatase SixA